MSVKDFCFKERPFSQFTKTLWISQHNNLGILQSQKRQWWKQVKNACNLLNLVFTTYIEINPEVTITTFLRIEIRLYLLPVSKSTN